MGVNFSSRQMQWSLTMQLSPFGRKYVRCKKAGALKMETYARVNGAPQ